MKTDRQSGLLAKRRRKAGVTLMELLVGMAISSVALGGSISLFLMGSNVAATGTGRLLINRDIRHFTNEMIENARYSDYFKTYTAYCDRTEQNDGGSGDFLVLAFRDTTDDEKISRVIGYYRFTAQEGEEGPVLMFDQEYDPPSESDLLDLLPSSSEYGEHEEVIELSNGLSDGKLFYNFYDRSIVVRGEIIHSGKAGEQVTNTYNFTISPRG